MDQDIKIKNDFFVSGDVVRILLPRRDGRVIFALVSTGTFFARIAPVATTWVLMEHENLNYAYAKSYADRPVGMQGGGKSLYLHRLALGLEHGNPLVADHSNFDGLDCTDANLRAVTRSENCARRRLSSKPSITSTTGWRNIRPTKHSTFSVVVAGAYFGTFKDVIAAQKVAAKARCGFRRCEWTVPTRCE